MPSFSPNSTTYLLLGLGIPAIVLLWLIFRAAARPGTSGAAKMVPRVFSGVGVMWALGVGGFIGLMIATAGGALFPTIVRVADPWVCEGTVSTISSRYSYKPGQSGVQHVMTCDAGDGSPPRDITLRVVATASAIYGAAAFVVLLIPVLLLGTLLPRLRTALRGKASEAGGWGGTPVGTQALQDLLRSNIQSVAGNGSSTSETSRTWVVVNNDKSSNPTIAALQDILLENADHTAIDAVMSMQKQAPAERLLALKALHEQGLLTASEYQAKRAEILAQL